MSLFIVVLTVVANVARSQFLRSITFPPRIGFQKRGPCGRNSIWATGRTCMPILILRITRKYPRRVMERLPSVICSHKVGKPAIVCTTRPLRSGYRGCVSAIIPTMTGLPVSFCLDKSCPRPGAKKQASEGDCRQTFFYFISAASSVMMDSSHDGLSAQSEPL